MSFRTPVVHGTQLRQDPGTAGSIFIGGHTTPGPQQGAGANAGYVVNPTTASGGMPMEGRYSWDAGRKSWVDNWERDYGIGGWGQPKRVGYDTVLASQPTRTPLHQTDLYQGDSYLRGKAGVDPASAYWLETDRIRAQAPAEAQRFQAMGQYGSSVAGSLANQSIAAGNTFGQMANNYYNTLGQMGHMGAALSAAGLAASSNAANAQMANNMGINVGGGFGVGGPGGPIAQGLMGGYGGQGGQSMSMQRGGGADERQRMLGQGFDYLGAAMGHLNSPNNQAMALAGLANNQFDQNRNATMNPMFLNAMTGNVPRGGFAPQQGGSGAASQQQGNAPQVQPQPPANFTQPGQVRPGYQANGSPATPQQMNARSAEAAAAGKHWNGGRGQGFATRKV